MVVTAQNVVAKWAPMAREVVRQWRDMEMVANDNQTEFHKARERAALMAWAQSRMNDAEFRPFAVMAMFQAQQR